MSTLGPFVLLDTDSSVTDPAQLLPPRVLIVDDERPIHASLRLRIGERCRLRRLLERGRHAADYFAGVIDE